MNLQDLKKPLDIKDVDFRVQSINKGGYATILAYKDARVDMNRLDEVCKPENWQRDHKEVKGVVYCGIGIKTTEWIWKWDAGSESLTEGEKGQASDSFKRAGFNWGIGRELYDYPLIQIKLEKGVEWDLVNDKPKQLYGLKLKDWVWGSEFKDGVLIKLAVKDTNGKLRFNWKR